MEHMKRMHGKPVAHCPIQSVHSPLLAQRSKADMASTSCLCALTPPNTEVQDRHGVKFLPPVGTDITACSLKSGSELMQDPTPLYGATCLEAAAHLQHVLAIEGSPRLVACSMSLTLWAAARRTLQCSLLCHFMLHIITLWSNELPPVAAFSALFPIV
eukprot:1157977-Pelagomonas_calceolata.AAC.12